MRNVVKLESLGLSHSAKLKAEIESDLRLAFEGSEKLGNQMLSYLIRMALAELNTDEKTNSIPADKYFYVE
ncbi:hypothetical protein [Cohaesibacter celericrescens]|uniref:hypothetical protein n=1 Tax=Cohaesibacter celericrescens TaxID=2067669 RepID=UPI0035632318